MIKVFGCSHSRIFKKIKLDNYTIDCESISGASLSGLPKKISTLDIKNRVISYLQDNQPDFLILKFGQVDIDLKYYYKIVVKGEDVNKIEYIKKLISCYKNFISEIENYIDKNKLIIFGINPPVLLDKESCLLYTSRIISNDKKYHDLLKSKIDTIESRTSFSRLFNTKLKEFCINNKIKYGEVFDEFLNLKNIVSNKYSSNNDHHLRGIESDENNFQPTNNLFKKKFFLLIS